MRTYLTLMLATLLLASSGAARAQSVSIGPAERACEYATQCGAVMIGCGCCGEGADGQFVVANARTVPSLTSMTKCSPEQITACSKRTDCPRPSAPAVTCENKQCVLKPKDAPTKQ